MNNKKKIEEHLESIRLLLVMHEDSKPEPDPDLPITDPRVEFQGRTLSSSLGIRFDGRVLFLDVHSRFSMSAEDENAPNMANLKLVPCKREDLLGGEISYMSDYNNTTFSDISNFYLVINTLWQVTWTEVGGIAPTNKIFKYIWRVITP